MPGLLYALFSMTAFKTPSADRGAVFSLLPADPPPEGTVAVQQYDLLLVLLIFLVEVGNHLGSRALR